MRTRPLPPVPPWGDCPGVAPSSGSVAAAFAADAKAGFTARGVLAASKGKIVAATGFMAGAGSIGLEYLELILPAKGLSFFDRNQGND